MSEFDEAVRSRSRSGPVVKHRKILGQTWPKNEAKSGPTAAKPSVEKARDHWLSFGGFGFALSVSSVPVQLSRAGRARYSGEL
jgi:hypothetical protein